MLRSRSVSVRSGSWPTAWVKTVPSREAESLAGHSSDCSIDTDRPKLQIVTSISHASISVHRRIKSDQMRLLHMPNGKLALGMAG